MAYKLRDQRAGFHHVAIRGNNRRSVFEDDGHRAFFSVTLNRIARRHGWKVYAYALMGNHFHLVLSVEEGGLAPGMCELNTAYACWFNRQHGRVNHLFGKRYWSEPLPDERRLFAAIRYVIQNPLRAGIEGPLEAHTWTSYAATIGLAVSRVKLAKSELLALFDSPIARAIERFKELCESPAPRRSRGRGKNRWQPP